MVEHPIQSTNLITAIRLFDLSNSRKASAMHSTNYADLKLLCDWLECRTDPELEAALGKDIVEFNLTASVIQTIIKCSKPYALHHLYKARVLAESIKLIRNYNGSNENKRAI